MNFDNEINNALVNKSYNLEEMAISQNNFYQHNNTQNAMHIPQVDNRPPIQLSYDPNSPLNNAKSFNDARRTYAEYNKHSAQMWIEDEVAFQRNQFVNYPQPIQPLQFIEDQDILNQMDDRLVSMAESFEQPNHQLILIIIMMLLNVSIATRGRVFVRVFTDWLLSVAMNLLAISDAGQRKSALIEKMRKPIVAFCMAKDLEYKAKHVSQAKVSSILTHAKWHERREMKTMTQDMPWNRETLQLLSALHDEYEDTNKPLLEQKQYVTPSVFLSSGSKVGAFKHYEQQGQAIGIITAEGDGINFLLSNKKFPLEYFNKSWDQEEIIDKVHGRDSNFTYATISSNHYVQPHIPRKLYENKDLIASGALGRILPFMNFEPSSYYNLRVPKDTSYDYDFFCSRINDILEMYFTQDFDAPRFEVQLEPEAQELIKAFELEIKQYHLPNAPHDAMASLNKLHGHAVKMAWCIHALFTEELHNIPISGYYMNQAILICRALINHIVFFCNPQMFRAYEHAIIILEKLQSVNLPQGNEHLSKGYITSAELQRMTHLKALQVENAFSILEQYNWIKQINAGNGTLIAVLHPSYINFKIK